MLSQDRFVVEYSLANKDFCASLTNSTICWFARQVFASYHYRYLLIAMLEDHNRGIGATPSEAIANAQAKIKTVVRMVRRESPASF